MYNGECLRDCPDTTNKDIENYLCKEKATENDCTLNEREILVDNIYNYEIINSLVKSYKNEYSYTNKHTIKYRNLGYNLFIYKDLDCIDLLDLKLVNIEIDSCINKVKEELIIEENLIIVYFEIIKDKISGYILYNPINSKRIDFESMCINEDIKTKDGFKYIELMSEKIPKECPPGLYPLVYLDREISYDNCKDKNFIYNKIYFDPIEEKFFQCYDSCKLCDKKGDENNHNCLQCEDGYIKHPLSRGKNFNCVEKCIYYYYLIPNGEYFCTNTQKCPDEYDKLIIEKNQCVDNCKNDDIYKYLYNNKCLISCPINASYEIIPYQICSEDCLPEELFLKQCKLSNKEVEIQDKLVDMIDNSLNKGLFDGNIIANVIENNEYLIYKEDEIILQIISSSDNNSITNISSINLVYF